MRERAADDRIAATERDVEEWFRAVVARLDAEADASPAASARGAERLRAMTREWMQTAWEEVRVQAEEVAAAREALESQLRVFQQLYDFAPAAYMVTSAEGVIRSANVAGARLLNVERRRLAGKPIAVFVLAGERTTFRAAVLRVANRGGTHDWGATIVPRQRAPVGVTMTVSLVPAAGSTSGGDALYWIVREDRQSMDADLA